MAAASDFLVFVIQKANGSNLSPETMGLFIQYCFNFCRNSASIQKYEAKVFFLYRKASARAFNYLKSKVDFRLAITFGSISIFW
jgi:hypothetical protein